ncbi:MAG TPA: PASTA domain-containing protein, partial [Rugosimonospora sp.]|nr:PASTA domain-containing protein [Rugosimonospora sp.]
SPPTRNLPVERPTWARLPVAAPHTGPHRRRRPREGGLLGWYRSTVGTTRGRNAFAAAAVVLGLVVVVGGWWFGIGRYTAAPNLVGRTKGQALVVATQLGFTITTDSGRHDEKVPKDNVLAQSPGPSQRILKGGRITLTLSLGPERYQLPDETGKSYDAAAADLGTIKMVPKRVDVYDDNMPAGNVVSTDPPAGTVVAPQTEVTLKVSKGKAPITVPDLTNQDVNAAEAQLSQLGLQYAVKPKQSDKPANTVIDQDPPPGSGVEKNATVILTVSTGPPLVTVPNVSNQGLSLDQANQILQQAGLTGVPIFNLGGQVRNQNPAAGTQVQSGSQVQLWVSP